MRAVVTGGAGFIGSHVAEALLARNDEVHVLDNLASGKLRNVPAGAEFHEADIRDPDAVFEAARPQAVFHLAAQADVGASVRRPDYDADVNVVGTVRVLEAARRHGAQVIFSSTGGAMYGECEEPATEQKEPAPLAPYGASKLAGEGYLQTWNRLHGTAHVVLRLANVYGPRQDSGLEGGVVAIFLERMAEEAPARIYGDGGQTRDFLYVGDVAAAMLAALGREGGLYNVASGEQTSISELHRLCVEVAGIEREPELTEPRLGDIRHSAISPALAERELGWRAQVALEDGLRRTWAWLSAT